MGLDQSSQHTKNNIEYRRKTDESTQRPVFKITFRSSQLLIASVTNRKRPFASRCGKRVGFGPMESRRLEKLLDSDELFEMEFEDCPVGVEERRQLRADMPWGVFTMIARLAADPTLNEQQIVQQLEELAGFGPLREVLERHFFKRSRLLRSFRILNDARRILNQIRFRHLPEVRQRDKADEARRDRFVSFIQSAQGDPSVAKELEEFVTRQLTPYRADHLEAVRRDLDRKFAQFFHDFEEYNADFEALTQLERHASLFTPSELNELRPLLGQYGLETEHRLAHPLTIEQLAERRQSWADIRLTSRQPIRRDVATRAEARYGLLLKELSDRSRSPSD